MASALTALASVFLEGIVSSLLIALSIQATLHYFYFLGGLHKSRADAERG
jgi:hypothetical protein